MSSIHQFTINTIEGKALPLSAFEGKKLLIVNTASACGLTPQYAQLQELYDQYRDKLEVIGFPCNQFGGQEPGSPEEISTFCSTRYGVTFPLSEKVEVKGSGIHPVFEWLTQKKLNGVSDAAIAWNFHKFLISESGTWEMSIASTESPLSDSILSVLK